jgi:hypothetical protein
MNTEDNDSYKEDFDTFQTTKTPVVKRKYKLRSSVWQHAVKCTINDELVFRCNECTVHFAWLESTTQMLKHIREEHGILVESSDEVIDDEGDLEPRDAKKC